MSTEITKPIDPLISFQTKVIDKLKSDIGALLPDEVLVGLVKRAVDETFFKDRVIKGTYSYNDTIKPSWFIEEVTNQAKPFLREEVKKFVEEKKEVLQKALRTFLTDNNLILVAMAELRNESVIEISSLRTAIDDLQKKMKL